MRISCMNRDCWSVLKSGENDVQKQSCHGRKSAVTGLFFVQAGRISQDGEWLLRYWDGVNPVSCLNFLRKLEVFRYPT